MDRIWFGRRAVTASSILLIGALGGCATGASSSAMAVNSTSSPGLTQQDHASQQLRIEHVQGGSKTNPLWMSNVSDDQFQQALKQSLQSAGYLSPDENAATLQLTASLIELKRPLAGFNMTVSTQVRYTVKNTQTGAIIFDETVAAKGTAKMGESLIGMERLKLANEHAVQNNIAEFIKRFHEAAAKMASNNSIKFALGA